MTLTFSLAPPTPQTPTLSSPPHPSYSHSPGTVSLPLFPSLFCTHSVSTHARKFFPLQCTFLLHTFTTPTFAVMLFCHLLLWCCTASSSNTCLYLSIFSPLVSSNSVCQLVFLRWVLLIVLVCVTELRIQQNILHFVVSNFLQIFRLSSFSRYCFQRRNSLCSAPNYVKRLTQFTNPSK